MFFFRSPVALFDFFWLLNKNVISENLECVFISHGYHFRIEFVAPPNSAILGVTLQTQFLKNFAKFRFFFFLLVGLLPAYYFLRFSDSPVFPHVFGFGTILCRILLQNPLKN